MLFNKIIKNESEVLNIVTDSLSSNENLLLTYLNQHCYNIYYTDTEFKKLLDKTFTVFLDGFGIYAALKILGFKSLQKFNATDLYLKVFQHFSDNNTQVFLIGGNFSNELISQKAGEKKIMISGYHNGYFNDEDIDNLITQIKKISPKVVVLGLGVPRQEIIAARIDRSIKNITLLCVGNFLEFYFGTKRRAPKILRLSGLEWFHRLLTEPDRLWKRYLIGIPIFLVHISKLKISSLWNKC